MLSAPDHYAVLDVSPDADEAAIRAAWRALCRKFHPDIARDVPDAADRFRAVNAAYAELNDPYRRFAYDLERQVQPGDDVPPAARWVESPYPMPPRRTGGATAALILAFVGLPAVALTLPGVPGQVAAMLPRDGSGVSGFARASLGQVRRLLTPAGLGGANAAGRPMPRPALPAIDPANVTLAAAQYARVIHRDGRAGIPSYAAACAQRAATFATWQSQDFCTAFDMAAGRFDRAQARARYARLGIDSTTADARIAQIRGSGPVR